MVLPLFVMVTFLKMVPPELWLPAAYARSSVKEWLIFQLLEFLILNAERVVRRTELLEKVWDLHFDPMSNVVDVHVGNLRRKLREAGAHQLLHTVRGVGYVFQREVPG